MVEVDQKDQDIDDIGEMGLGRLIRLHLEFIHVIKERKIRSIVIIGVRFL